MHVEITIYLFKGPAEKELGVEYLKNNYLPEKKTKPGFVSGMVGDNGPDSVAVLLRFDTTEQARVAYADRDAFKAFVALLAGKPERATGENLANFENAALA